MWTNNRDFRNILIPYEFPNVSELCMNGHRYSDDHLDYYADVTLKDLYLYGIRKFEIEAEILAHLRVQALHPGRKYELKMDMCCTTDHKMYRAYWTWLWKE